MRSPADPFEGEADRTTPDPWLIEGNPREGSLVDLYCVPSAGAGAATYRKWPEALPSWVQVRRVQPPGRETRFREPFCPDLETYVDTLAELVTRNPARPFALFGHSMGALVSFEVAHAIRRRSCREPIHIFASGFRAPQIELPAPIHELPDPAFIGQLRHRYGGVPDAVLQHPELLEIMLPIVRSDLGLLSSYEHEAREPLTCALTAIGGRSDPSVGEGDLRRWAELTRGPFELLMVEGGHFFLDGALDRVLTTVRKGVSEAASR